ncbi:MFS transporter [bacterium]|nr:MFS transporter [bacterium]
MTTTQDVENDVEASTPSRHVPEGLWSRSFLGLLIVQFTTALNDNTFRWLVIPIAKPLVGDAVALAVGLAGFTLPFLLCAAPAGFLADRFSKAKIITIFRFVEACVLGCGLLAILTLNPVLLFAIVVATGALTALFTPSKFGSLPEIVHDSELSTANGYMGLMLVVPSAIGLFLGNLLVGYVQPEANGPIHAGGLLLAAAVIMTAATSGWLASLMIRRVPSVNPERTWSWNLVSDTWTSLRDLAALPVVFRTALGITFFWMLAALAQINIDTFSRHDLALSQRDVGIFGMILVAGLGTGSVLAGLVSVGRIELGIVPVGAAGIAACCCVLFGAGWWSASNPVAAYYISALALFGLGVSAGCFDVPLEAYLQHRSPPAQLGSILAATNFVVSLSILMISAVFYLLNGVLHLSAGTIFLLAGLGTIPVGIIIARQIPATMFRLLTWVLSRVAYRLRVYGLENIPRTGSVMLVSNHVTWVDGLLLLVTVPRPVRFIVYADFVENPKLNWLARIFEIIPIRAHGSPKALMQSIKTAREALHNGECVCIFAEGALTRTGQMQPFQPGFLKILQGTQAPVVPICLHGLWGSIFSFRDGKFFWKWPRAWRYPVTILFGQPIPQPESPGQVGLAVRELGLQAVDYERDHSLTPARMFLRACRRRKSQSKIADSSGMELNGGRLLTASLAFRQVLARNVLKPDEERVGIFLPPTVACALVNAAVTLNRRVTVNLNYTMSEQDLRFCVQEAGLTHIITSRKMLEKKPVELGAEFVFIEDLKEKITGFDKARAFLGAYVWPIAILERWLGLTSVPLNDPMTCIFTSGSTGEPKGVVLSHQNIRSTVDGADQLFQINQNDVVLGVIPLFHSLGFLATLWLPLCLDPKVVYHINPLDARQIGELAEKHKATILFATPTFLRTYLKRCTPEQFAHLDLVVVGAEKLPPDLAQQFQEKFNVVPTEGYGATETTGPAAVNVPDHRCEMTTQIGTKLGTVGRPMPDVLVRVVDPDTKQLLPQGSEGLLEIKGPNVMLGYLNRPEKTATVIRDGWYNSGDMAKVDLEGFIQITGRLSRFSKIGGEMVPHIKIEECLLGILETSHGEETGPLLAVTAVPDPKKGERIVVLHRPLSKDVPSILKELGACDLPNLWLPDAEAFAEVSEIPLLGTGKTDLKAVKQLAAERFSTTSTVL